MFQDFKSPLSSLTIQGAFVAFLVSLLGVFGIELAPGVVPNLNEIITGIAAIVAIYGRYRARTLIVRPDPTDTR